MLDWLRADCLALEDWKQACLAPNVITEPVHKWVLSGKTVPQPASMNLNGLSLKDWLPAPRLRAWFRAFKDVNQQFLATMLARARAALSSFDEESLGQNGQHFMHADFESWFLAASELHIFDSPEMRFEPRHNDGGASVLHMGITLYGRRRVTFFEPISGSASGQEEEREVCFAQQPGSVYLGTVTGASHQVSHVVTRNPEEELRAHTVSVMLRTCLFPYNRARCQNTTPSPPEVFRALASSLTEHLVAHRLELPSLARVQAALE